ncbi:subtilisin-like serine protease, partial [Serendipita sp. 399]
MQRILADPNVEYIVPDHIATISYEALHPPKRGLVNAFGKVDPLATNGTDGQGVDIYGLDSGIYLEHHDFGGRATWGVTFGGYNSTDDNGHGTHTASIAAGAQYGVAKAANLIAVKVLGWGGTGSYSDIIAGIEWVMKNAASTGRPSVANLSLNGPRDSTLNDAVKAAIASGVHFTVASGNDGVDASGSSPCSVEEANTVGAADRDNISASFSNTGPIVDVYSLGVDVPAAWVTGPDDSRVLSGTSMAAPRVAGILATAISRRGNTSPSELTAALVEHAQHVITGQPSNTTSPRSFYHAFRSPASATISLSDLHFSRDPDGKVYARFKKVPEKQGHVCTPFEFGSGMHSSTWLARDNAEGKYVAVKALTGYLTYLSQKKSIWEAEALAKLSEPPISPHCIQLLDQFTIPGKGSAGKHLCFVMPVYGGDARSQYLANEKKPFPPPLVKHILLHILRGLAHAHSHKIVHTDLKLDQFFYETKLTTEEIDKCVESEPPRRHPPEMSKDRIVHVAVSQPLPIISYDEALTATYVLGDFGCAVDGRYRQEHTITSPMLRPPEVFLGGFW